jgi:adenosine deaminase
VFKTLAEHNLKRMLELGLCATINSDDPAYFGGYINQNFLETFAALKLDRTQARTLAANSFEASFADAEQKRSYTDKLAAYCEARH